MNRLVVLLVVAIPMFLMSDLIEINIDGGMDFCSIQEAIDNSISGDTLLVHPGIYQENINFGGRDICVISLYYATGDSSYIENTVIGDVEEGCVVTFENCETSSAILGGLSIREGWGDTYPDYRAGGISCLNYSSPTLKDLNIYGNNYGASGGIYCEYSDPLIMNCHIHDNTSYVAIYGGGVTLYHSDAHIINCLIEDNFTSVYGGGICVFSLSDPVIENTIIRANHAESGGGIYAQACNLTLNDVLIESNDGGYGGGIALYYYVNPYFENVICKMNDSSRGGGLYLRGLDCQITGIDLIENTSGVGGAMQIFNSEVTLSELEICGNSAYNAGSAYISYYSQVNIENSTFSGNSSDYESVIMYGTSSLNLYNCIMADEGASVNFDNYFGINNSLEVNYCNFTGGEESLDCDNYGTYVWGGGNISVDPGFACPEMSDWRLMYYSECIDAGDPESEYDPDGTIRDLGANFYDQENGAYPEIDIPEYLHFESGEIVEMDFAQYIYDVNPDELVLTVAGNTNVTIEINDLEVVFSCNENWAGIEELTFSINDNSGRLISSDIMTVNVTKDVINVPEDFVNIQDAIEQAAVDSAMIIVAPGEYHENLDFLGKNISLVSYFETTGDTTYINETIIDGDSLGTVIRAVDCERFRITGFTIRNGVGIDNAGGIYIENTGIVQIENSIIENNQNYGIRNGNDSDITNLFLHDLAIRNNTLSGLSLKDIVSGEIYNIDLYGNLLNGSTSKNLIGGSGEDSYLFMDNIEINAGSEIVSNDILQIKSFFLSDISNIIVENVFSPNQGYTALMFKYMENANISDIVIRNCSADNFGGGLRLYHCSNLILDRAMILNNQAGSIGGIYVSYCDNEPVIISNSLIQGNIAENSTSAIRFYNGTAYFVNCTIVNNTSQNGAAIYVSTESPEEPYLINCIVYDNDPAQIQLGSPSNRNRIIHVDHCNVEGGEEGVIQGESSILYWHEGNIDLPPEFIEEAPYPFSLAESSPCVDAGTTEFPIDFELPLTDLAGNERIWGETIDMGCYEFGAPPYVGNIECEIENVKCKIDNYPNPFNPTTTISFSIPEQADNAELNIYNMKGQRVRTFKIQNSKFKINEVVWDGSDDCGNFVSSGIYFCRVKCGANSAVHRMMLIK